MLEFVICGRSVEIVLAALAPHLAEAERVAVLGEALAAARSIEGDQSSALAALAPCLFELRFDLLVLAFPIVAALAERPDEGVGRA